MGRDRGRALLGGDQRVDALVYIGAVTVTLAGAWALSYAMGGSKTPLPHLFYVPIVLAALGFTWPGTLVVALAAGVVAGPLLPHDVDAGLAQTPSAWILRLAMFAAIGLFIALALRGRSSPLQQALGDAVVSHRMRIGIRRHEIEPYYQPIYDLHTSTIIGVEALARWHHPHRGWIAPDAFIPRAERTGAVIALDHFMLRQVATTVQAWASEVGPIRASVNVSAMSFARNDLLDTVRRVLEETGLPAVQLELEITESAFMADPESTAREVAELRGMGVRVAIDDFSAGQSSLVYLSHFPVDTVKLDRSLIGSVTTDNRLARLVAGVVVMVHGLDVSVVAEGVETKEQLAYLDAVDCRFAQGFYVGRPAPADEALALLQSGRHTHVLNR